VLAWIDRVNVGFAKLQMLQDLQFSEAVYGLGAGIFFIGYFLFEVPSNLLLERSAPARRWPHHHPLGPPMAMAYVTTPTSSTCCASCWAWLKPASSPAWCCI
jgi:hypothetical protein